MLCRKVQKVKNVRIITLPAQICDVLGIQAGDLLGVEIKDEKIILVPKSG